MNAAMENARQAIRDVANREFCRTQDRIANLRKLADYASDAADAMERYAAERAQTEAA